VKRREFITLLGGAAVAWPLVARTQQATMPVVGFLNSASANGYASMANAFKQGLKETGYIEGHNVAIEYRWADNQNNRLPALAADLVSQHVIVIFANSPSVTAARAATDTIPIIFMTGDDPVRLGFVPSFNRPGGNITGVTILSGALAAKRLGLLRELLPRAKTIAVLIDLGFQPSEGFEADVEASALILGLSIQRLEASSDREIEAAFTKLIEAQVDALLVGPGPFLDSRRDLLIGLAAKAAIPAAYETRTTAVAGGLISYGASVGDGYRQAGIYTGRVLKGAKPSELPILQPTAFELVINLRTAKPLGIEISPMLLARADEVIE
jgi:putative tryptophan/tyrosine transport system substrate-binding protein